MRRHNRVFLRRGTATDFFPRPDVELALLVLGVGVQRGKVAAFRRLHFAHDPAGGFLGDALEQGVPGHSPGIRIQAQQRPVVVEHLLEVRDRPALVHAVAAETAADLVEEPAFGHAAEGMQRHLAAACFARRRMAAQQQFQVGRMGEFRRAAETAEIRIVGLRRTLDGQLEGGGREFSAQGPSRGARRERLEQFAVLLLDVGATVAPGISHLLAQAREAGQAVARRFREIGAAEKRRAVRREEHRQRPAAGAAGQHLVGGLVDLVEVGPLLAIHLDVHEEAVHHRRHLRILEGFVGHDMAPVTGRIADGEQDRLAFPLRQGERFLTPWMPIHGVLGVLLQIGRGLAGEAVGHAPSVVSRRL